MRRVYFLFLVTFFLQINSFAQPSVSVASYDDLVHEVRAAFARGEERTADAVERERVRTYWEVGKLIHEHILLHKERAEYGEKVLKRLSVDLQIGERQLYYMWEFARTYPNLKPASNLSWSHYQALLSINDTEKRRTLADRAANENWNRQTLRQEIGKLRIENPQSVSAVLEIDPLIPIKGKLDHYKIIVAESGKWQGKPVINLGFSNYYRPDKLPFKEGDIVHSKNGKLELTKDGSESDLYTYKASVLNITDGDTLWILVDLGFGFFTKQHVRLRGIDAPEITTRDGQAAKEFVEKELSFPHALTGPRLYEPKGSERNPKSGSLPESINRGSSTSPPTKTFGGDAKRRFGDDKQVVITTSKSDKYDRYLVDIFYETKSGEKFLNNELLTRHFAERV